MRVKACHVFFHDYENNSALELLECLKDMFSLYWWKLNHEDIAVLKMSQSFLVFKWLNM